MQKIKNKHFSVCIGKAARQNKGHNPIYIVRLMLQANINLILNSLHLQQ